MGRHVRIALRREFQYVEGMTVELTPEQERIIHEQLAGGHYQSVDEVLTTALSRLSHERRSNGIAVQRMLDFARRHSVKLPPGERVKDLVHEGHRY